MRVTDAMQGDLLRWDLQTVQGQMMNEQQQLATGHRIQVPSDDPVGTENVLQWQAALDQNTQDQANAKDAQAWLETGQSALQQAVTQVQRIRTLALEANQGTLTPQQLQSVAEQVSASQDALAQAAAARVGDSYIFSGDQTETQPFVLGTSGYTYAGGSGSVTRELVPGVQVAVNVNGGTVFGPVFAAVRQILGDLGKGNPGAVAGKDLTTLDSALNGLIGAEGQVGGILQQVTSGQSQLTATGVALQKLQAGTLDTDVTQAVVRLQQLQLSYQSALAVGAQLMRQTLADYLQ